MMSQSADTRCPRSYGTREAVEVNNRAGRLCQKPTTYRTLLLIRLWQGIHTGKVGKERQYDKNDIT